MGHIETRFRAAASPELGFDLVVDVTRYLGWQSLLQELLTLSGPTDAVGTSFTGRYRVLRGNLPVRFVVTAAVRPYLHEMTGTTRGGWVRWATHLEAGSDDPLGLGTSGSLVRVELDYRLSGDLVGGLVALVTDPILRREVQRSYSRFQEILAVPDAPDAIAVVPDRHDFPPTAS
jgi:hypothetical protein